MFCCRSVDLNYEEFLGNFHDDADDDTTFQSTFRPNGFDDGGEGCWNSNCGGCSILEKEAFQSTHMSCSLSMLSAFVFAFPVDDDLTLPWCGHMQYHPIFLYQHHPRVYDVVHAHYCIFCSFYVGLIGIAHDHQLHLWFHHHRRRILPLTYLRHHQ